MPSAENDGKSGYHALMARAISTVSRIIGPVTSEIPRQSASRHLLKDLSCSPA